MRSFITAVRDRTWLQCIVLLLALLSIFVLTHSGYEGSEAIYHYRIADHIVKYGELSLPTMEYGVYILAPNGRTYASHEIGNVLFLLPVAFLNNSIEKRLTPVIGPERVTMATRFLAASMGAVLCSVGAVFLYLILRLVFDQPIRPAFVGVLLFSFCSFYWSYSRMAFDGVLCAILLLAAMLCLFLFARRRETWLLIAAFALLGYGFITRLSMLLAIVAAGIYLLLVLGPRLKQVRHAAIVASLTLAPFVAWQLYYNHLRTGNYFMSPVQSPKYFDNGLTGNVFVGLLGLLFSPGKSILVYCPPALLSLFLVRKFYRTARNEAVFVVALSVFWLLLHAKLHSWYGAWGWGPRHFITVTPVMAIPFLVERFSLRWLPAKVLAAATLSFGFLLGIASIIVNYQYRTQLALPGGGLETTWVWSITGNQAVDALVAAVRNLHTLVFGGVYLVVPGISAANMAASNTVNIWWVTAHRMGIGAMPLALCVAALTIFAGLGLWLVYQAGSDKPGAPAASSREPVRKIDSSFAFQPGPPAS